ncbi:DUF2306 domain-containing protein [Paracoccus sp. R12_1]|jgi:uncharacterized membrane protein|uniref:DUF2306 domain-containing protein n=1 Tax=unclassified Paracoccus (in: a-proteobacteria) TaxID=2688777 RepID=UPI000C0ACBA6|nr:MULTISPECIES: DUF2306 domain-containing protein [unclassified Paracoccus (in: a-proteobacteria)]MBO9454571.1 DUF2306 domain-containing protein [Paracoccus sp. R12_2]MBO9486125.1 DUF2306 domain-containing protein [Paracoccus sp. R12_1]PHQ68922.1 MAG: hypothetical protein COB97_08885 [Paracoccus sp. (in: a-proteobacteria)]
MFDPLIHAPIAIQIHVAVVIPAALLGVALLLGRKGTNRHRFWGRIWIILMVVAAVSSFWIQTIRVIGPFSPIHLLSALTLVLCVRIPMLARAGRITAHRRSVTQLFWFALVGAGAFTFLPGRIMHHVAFSAGQSWGLAFLGLLAAGLVWLAIHTRAAREFR